VELALSWTGGYPFYIQQFGKHAWSLAARSPIGTADVEAAMPAAEAALDTSIYATEEYSYVDFTVPRFAEFMTRCMPYRAPRSARNALNARRECRASWGRQLTMIDQDEQFAAVFSPGGRSTRWSGPPAQAAGTAVAKTLPDPAGPAERPSALQLLHAFACGVEEGVGAVALLSQQPVLGTRPRKLRPQTAQGNVGVEQPDVPVAHSQQHVVTDAHYTSIVIRVFAAGQRPCKFAVPVKVLTQPIGPPLRAFVSALWVSALPNPA
jgi:hypothetical protein